MTDLEPIEVQQPKRPFYKSASLWMTAAFVSVLGGMGLYGKSQMNLQNELSSWKDTSNDIVDPKTTYESARNAKPSQLIFFYQPPSANNPVPVMSNAAYYYVDDQNMFHFGAVRGDAKFTSDMQQFKSFQKTVDESRAKSESHKYQGMIFVSSNGLGLNESATTFAACDLQHFCMGSQVKGFQATAFAIDHMRKLDGFQDAAKRGDLLAFVVPIKDGINEYKPFDAVSAQRVSGTEAALLLAQQMRKFGAVAKVAGQYSQNGIISVDVIEKLPVTERDYWVELYSYSAARDKNMALPQRNYGGGRDVKTYSTMMVLQSDKNGALTINEFGFENIVGESEPSILYAEPYVRIYTRNMPLTDSEKNYGVDFAPKPLTESGWALNVTMHGDDAKNHILKLQNDIKSKALDITGTPEVNERAIQIYCYKDGDKRLTENAQRYAFPSDRQARFVMLDVCRDVMIFGIQVDTIYAPNLQQIFKQKSVDKVSTVGPAVLLDQRSKQR